MDFLDSLRASNPGCECQGPTRLNLHQKFEGKRQLRMPVLRSIEASMLPAMIQGRGHHAVLLHKQLGDLARNSGHLPPIKQQQPLSRASLFQQWGHA